MIVDAKRSIIELPHRAIVSLADGAGARIDCLHGRIWITERGVAGDVVLEAGESYELVQSGLAVVQALRGGRIGVQAPAVSLAGAAFAAPWVRLRHRWVERATGRSRIVIDCMRPIPSVSQSPGVRG